MKLNITKLFYEDIVDCENINYDYLDKAKEKKKNHWSDSRRRYAKTYIPASIFHKRCEKFLGCNISQLYYSIAKNGSYTESIHNLIRVHVGMTNKSGELVCSSGYVSDHDVYYTDENNILCKHNRPRRKSRPSFKTELELIADEYWKAKETIKSRKEEYTVAKNYHFGKFNQAELNRYLKPYQAKLARIEKEYNLLFNFKYNRGVRDKSDKYIRVIKPANKISNLNIKPKKVNVKIKEIVKPSNLIRKSIFSALTGLS